MVRKPRSMTDIVATLPVLYQRERQPKPGLQRPKSRGIRLLPVREGDFREWRSSASIAEVEVTDSGEFGADSKAKRGHPGS